MSNCRRTNWVKAGQHGWISTKEVTFLNIEESFQGDVMSFQYMGQEYKSLIVQGSRPG